MLEPKVPPERTYRALLIGNGTYRAPRERPSNLFGPANDVEAVRSALCHSDWGLHSADHVEVVVDAPRDEIARAVERLFTSATDLDQLFFFYSGHGIQQAFDRLYLCAADTEEDLPTSTCMPVEMINALAESTRAQATVVVLDCCYGGILKGPDPAVAAQGRGRWLLAGCRRDQGAADAKARGGLSPFAELVAEGLVGADALDQDHDGFVTIADVNRHVTPRLEERTGQIPTFRFEGSGELAVALAPGYPTEFDQRIEAVVRRGDVLVAAPAIPRVVNAPADSDIPSGRDDAEIEVPGPGTSEPMLIREVTKALRQTDEITLRLMLQGAVRHLGQSVQVPEAHEDAYGALDVLTVTAATTLNLGATEWFERSIAALRRGYEFGFDDRGNRRNPAEGAIRPVVLWLSIFQRVLALGALAVRLEAWSAVRELALQRPDGQDFRHYKNWMRHALTEAARAELFRVERDGQRAETSPIVMAKDYALGHGALIPDLFDGNEEQLLTSLCQFDALACVTALCATPDEHGSQFYPNFARFYTYRSEPALAQLVTDPAIRGVLAPVDDAALTTALVEVDRVARGEARMFDGWWGYESEAIKEFIENSPSTAADD
jgi:hypothetical protein